MRYQDPLRQLSKQAVSGADADVITVDQRKTATVPWYSFNFVHALKQQ
jgi:hypothetical protein